MSTWIDTHGHVNSVTFKDTWKEVLDRTLAQDVWVVSPGFQHWTSEQGLHIAEHYTQGVYTALGFHPTHVGETRNIFNKSAFEKMLPHPKIVAIGETGLDYYRIDQARFEELQKGQQEVLREHIDLATRFDLPLIAHCRDAYDDLYAIFCEELEKGHLQRRGVVHCYVGDWDTAQKFLNIGFLISFTGIITFTDDEGLLETVRNIPMGKFMVETDAPYLSPVPHRGKQNEPLRVVHVGEKIAELKGIGVEEIATATTQTARDLFRI